MADLRSKNGAEGFLLLTIDGVEVLRDDNVASSSSGSSVARETIGTLSVECVTFPHSAADAESELAGRDVFLVLRIAHHGMQLMFLNAVSLTEFRVRHRPRPGHHL